MTRRQTTLRPIKPKKTDEVRYRRAILNILRPLFAETKKVITAIMRSNENEYVKDSWVDEIQRALINIKQTRALLDNVIPETVGNVFDALKKSNDKAVREEIHKKIGVDVFFNDEPLKIALQARVNENINLIKSIGDEYLNDINTLVYEAGLNGTRASEIAKEIAKKADISIRRANFIARDQINKFNANLNETKQRQLGVEEYIWRNSRDGRVRGNPAGLYPNSKYDHWSREGKKYRYDKPPADGNPGEPYGCRCSAEAVIDFDKLVERGTLLNV